MYDQISESYCLTGCPSSWQAQQHDWSWGGKEQPEFCFSNLCKSPTILPLLVSTPKLDPYSHIHFTSDSSQLKPQLGEELSADRTQAGFHSPSWYIHLYTYLNFIRPCLLGNISATDSLSDDGVDPETATGPGSSSKIMVQKSGENQLIW